MDSDDSYFPNGTTKLSLETSSSVSWYPARQSDVIAIDFGTSTLSLAYKIHGRVNPLRIQEECADQYIPTVLLINDRGSAEIGERALLNYSNLENIDVKKSLFFDKVKLELQNDKAVSRDFRISGSDGKQYFLIEVIGLILKKVKERLSVFFASRNDKYSVDDFHWILTIPALWGERAREMMREAAYMAGLCSSHPKWNEMLCLPLRPASTHSIGSIKEYELHPERLSLVFEPDAAATWCKQLTEDTVRTCKDSQDPVTTDQYFLTIDVGGGTIDVTAHQVLENGRMKRVNIPHGEIFGGTVVNKTFETILGSEIVCDPGFKKYLSGQYKSENKAELFGLINYHFEITKKRYGETYMNGTSYVVQLPFSFAQTYSSSLMKFNNKRITDGYAFAYRPRTCQLELSSSIMSSCFTKTLQKLTACIKAAESAVKIQHGDHFEIFYLVGGFGGCNYIADKVREAVDVKVIVPENHGLAVVQGACVYYEKQILSSADATYGTGISVKFDPENPIHANASHYFDDDGIKRCNNIFRPILQVGQDLQEGHILLDQYIPIYKNQSTMSISVYSTTAHYVNFTDGKDGKQLNHAANMIVDLSEGMHLPVTDRVVDVIFDFNGIEVKIYARFKHSQKRVNASIDFLSTLRKFDTI